MKRCICLVLLMALTAGCVKPRYGMVADADGKLMYGSCLTNDFIVDPALFGGKRLKVRIRNTSGDEKFDLVHFKNDLEQAYQNTGYLIGQHNNFSAYLDINVKYSGHIQDDYRREGERLGTVAGTLAGAQPGFAKNEMGQMLMGGTIGAVVGATIGTVAGTFVTDDTYIIVADISLGTLGINDNDGATSLLFGMSPQKTTIKNTLRNFRGLKKVRLYVYAGGRMIEQKEIAEGVRKRFVRILKDII